MSLILIIKQFIYSFGIVFFYTNKIVVNCYFLFFQVLFLILNRTILKETFENNKIVYWNNIFEIIITILNFFNLESNLITGIFSYLFLISYIIVSCYNMYIFKKKNKPILTLDDIELKVINNDFSEKLNTNYY